MFHSIAKFVFVLWFYEFLSLFTPLKSYWFLTEFPHQTCCFCIVSTRKHQYLLAGTALGHCETELAGQNFLASVVEYQFLDFMIVRAFLYSTVSLTSSIWICPTKILIVKTSEITCPSFCLDPNYLACSFTSRKNFSRILFWVRPWRDRNAQQF